MSFFSGFFNGLDIPSLFTSLYALVVFLLIGGVHCCGSDGEGRCEKPDGEGGGNEEDSAYSELETQIGELRSQWEQGNQEVRRDLADAYLALAVQLQQDEYVEESVAMFDEALNIFSGLHSENGEDHETARLLGLIHLSKAVALNDLDQKEDALEGYQSALDILDPLAQGGDGEAKYDIAGIKLNLGTINHELGELEKAQQLLDDSFTDFRALEKISELDTRFYMGKASVALANLARDREEPIEKIVELYNRSMRLYVELIDAGDMGIELDLANVLIDKCMARFEAGHGEEVLIDVQRGIEILERLAADGSNLEASYDLFAAMLAYGFMLVQLEKYNDAMSVLNEIEEKFKDLEHTDDPMLLNEFAGLYDNRGMCFFHLQKSDEALADLTKGIELRKSLWGEDWELEEDELIHFAPVLVSAYCNRAMIFEALGKKDLALEDCNEAKKLLEPYADELGEDYQEFCEQIQSIEDGENE